MLNNKFKLSLILLFIACLLFVSVSSVSATDVQGNNFTALNDTISGNNVIDLTQNITVANSEKLSFKDGINITKDLTINGNGYSIDGNNSVRIFNIVNSSAVLTLNNVTLKNGNANYGGAIFGGNGYINLNCIGNVYFINNTATQRGGALSVESTTGDVNITISGNNVFFEDNNAVNYGGAINVYTTDSSSMAKVFISANNLYFNNNTAKNAGAIFAYSKSGNVNVTLDVIGDVDFINNNATAGNGGAIYANNVFITANNVKFINNTANAGGAIYSYIITKIAKVNIISKNNTEFINNTALNGYGAGIFTYSNVTCDISILSENITFIKNEATLNGGGIFAYSELGSINLNLKANNRILFNNNVAKDGAGIYTYGDTGLGDKNISAKDISFANNNAYGNGGAICTAGDLNIKGKSSFISNNAVPGNGGAIWITGSIISDNAIIFINNSAYVDEDDNYGCGGAIYTNNITIIAKSISFENNYVESYGGAIYSEGYVNVTNAIFLNNDAEKYGMAICFNNLSNSNFNYNYWGLNDMLDKFDDSVIFNYDTWESVIPDYWVLLNITPSKEIIVGCNNIFKLRFNSYTNGTWIRSYNNFTCSMVVKTSYDGGIATETPVAPGNFIVIPNKIAGSTLSILNYYTGEEITNVTFNVVPMNSTLKIFVNNITYGDDAKIIIYLIGDDNKTITTQVNLTIDTINRVVDIVKGIGTIDIKNLPAKDSYTITVKYAGDTTHNNVTNSTTFKVAKKEVVLNANDLILYVGESGNLTITTSEVINGNVTVKYNSKSQNVEIINGKGILEIGNLTVGSYDVNISLNTNPNYVAKNITSKIIVTQAFKEDSNMTIDVNDAIFPNYNYVFINLTYANGTPISDYVHIYVYNLNGTLELYKKYFIEGTLNTTLPVYFPGIYNVVVSYEGNDTVNPSTKSAAFYLKKATVDMDLLLGSITYGETGVLSITASNNFTGTVKVFIDDEFVSDVKLKNGSGSIALENYDAGTYNVVVSYAGNKTHEAVNATTTWIVNRANIKINNITLNDIVYGETTPFIIELSENITDDFYLLINNQITMAKFINGVFNSNMTADAGTYGITILYLGNNNYNGVAQNLVWYVVQKPVNIELNITDITYGGDGILNIVTDNNLNETVSVFVNGNFIGFVTLNNGTASVILSGYNASQYKVGVWFTGSKNYKESDATTIWNVFQADTSFEISTENITTDEEEIITVYVGNNLTGVAIIKGLLDNSVSIRVVNGTGYVAISDLNRGTYNISGIFVPEDNNYNKALNTSSFTVIDENIYIQISDLVKIYGTKDIFKAVLVDGEGKPLSYKKVIFTINGVSYTKETDLFGVASLNINLNAGEYPIKVTYGDIKEYATVYVVSTVKANDTTLMYKNGTKYEAIFTDSNGKVLANINVTFNINGVFYNKITDSNGKASLAINLLPGEYIITTSNPVTGQSHSNKITVLPPLVGYDLSKTYGKEGAYKVEAYNNQGKPLANATVTINIHGVFYNKITDVNGWAFLDINLEPGEYIATAYLNGYSTSNKITVVKA